MSKRAADAPLCERYDVALLDLDGVVYRGGRAVPHAVSSLAEATAAGMRLAYVTNNASRTPGAVATHLRELGIDAAPEDVVTSAQAGARLLVGLVPSGSPVLVVGGEGLQVAVAERGFRPVSSMAEEPAAVIQGFSPQLQWPELAEAAYAVTAGLPWVATNVDLTVPTDRGIAPGNGTMVAAVATATGRQPVVAGKPHPPLHRESIDRTGAKAPLTVGDRLDTDIEGAAAAGTDSLLVLTGVTGPFDVCLAAPEHRPTYIAADLRALLSAPVRAQRREGDQPTWFSEGWVASVDGDRVDVELMSSEPASPQTHERRSVWCPPLNALAAACWYLLDEGSQPDEESLRRAVQRVERSSDGDAYQDPDSHAG